MKRRLGVTSKSVTPEIMVRSSSVALSYPAASRLSQYASRVDTELDWNHVDAYVMAWAAIDRNGSGTMKTDDEVRELLANLPQPLTREDLDDVALQEIAGALRQSTCYTHRSKYR